MKTIHFILLVLVAAGPSCFRTAVRDTVAEHPLTVRHVHKHNDNLQERAATHGFEERMGYDVFTNVTAIGPRHYWVCKRSVFSVEDVESVTIKMPDGADSSLLVKLTPAGSRKLGRGVFAPSQSDPVGLAFFYGAKLLAVGELEDLPAHLDLLSLNPVYVNTQWREYKQLTIRNRTEPNP